MREPEPNHAPKRSRPKAASDLYEESMMLRKSLFSLVSLLAFATSAQAAGTFYKTEDEATQACSSDAVVWLKLDAHLYFHKEQTGYGVADGLYACEKGARKAGYFAAK
jgi:hypothetical protein